MYTSIYIYIYTCIYYNTGYLLIICSAPCSNTFASGLIPDLVTSPSDQAEFVQSMF